MLSGVSGHVLCNVHVMVDSKLETKHISQHFINELKVVKPLSLRNSTKVFC